MALVFGEIPRYVHERHVRRYIDRILQLPLVFPEPPPDPRPMFGPKPLRRARLMEWIQQPARFPSGYTKLAMHDPAWREKYNATWVAKRKAKGLPHHIHEQFPGRKPPTSVRAGGERKGKTA